MSQSDNKTNWKEKYNKLHKDYNNIRKELNDIKNKQNKKTNTHKIKHSKEFWQDIRYKLDIGDTDSIKLMIKNKKLTVNDKDFKGKTILSLSAWKGLEDLSRFCINGGADLKSKDDEGRTALILAKGQAYYNIEQLLLFAQMNVNVGNEIKDLSNDIIKQNGINENILNQLSSLDKQKKETFIQILQELMVNVINKRQSFSDQLLNLCWDICMRDGKNPLKSELWKALKNQCAEIIKNGSKRDWFWMKQLVLPSTVWFISYNAFSFFLFMSKLPKMCEDNTHFFLFFIVL